MAAKLKNRFMNEIIIFTI